MSSEKSPKLSTTLRSNNYTSRSVSNLTDYGKIVNSGPEHIRNNGYGNNVMQTMNYGYKGIQLKKEEQEENIQLKQEGRPSIDNNTGIPENLKSGVENLSGFSMNDVKVHYNSDKPTQLQAHAYAQGTDIHVAPGQEKHLPHETWHVVQQKQGRVKPTMQLKNVAVNDNDELEKEADIMGAKAMNPTALGKSAISGEKPAAAAQRAKQGNVPMDTQAIQLFPDFASWKASKNDASKQEIDFYKAFLLDLVEALKPVFKTIEKNDLNKSTKEKDIGDIRLKSLLAKIKELHGRILKNKKVSPEELDQAATALTELETATALSEQPEHDPLEDSRNAMQTSDFGPLPNEVIQKILSFTSITGLAAIRGTNRFLSYLADTTLVFKMRIPKMSAELSVTFQDVSNYMNNFEPVGLHGSSDADKMSLYKGLEERKEDKDKVYKTSQLGPGFYLTDGNGNQDKVYSKSVADERSKMTKTDAVVFRVFLKTNRVETTEVPKEIWADMGKDKTPQELTNLSKEPKLLTAPIVKNESVKQIKVNAPLFELVRVLPPADKMDEEFYNWISALCKQNPFEIGQVEFK